MSRPQQQPERQRLLQVWHLLMLLVVMLTTASDAHLVGHVFYADLACSKQVTEAIPYLHQLLACMPSAER